MWKCKWQNWFTKKGYHKTNDISDSASTFLTLLVILLTKMNNKYQTRSMLKQHLQIRWYDTQKRCGWWGWIAGMRSEWRLFQNILLGNIKLDLGNKKHITASCFAPHSSPPRRVFIIFAWLSFQLSRHPSHHTSQSSDGWALFMRLWRAPRHGSVHARRPAD